MFVIFTFSTENGKFDGYIWLISTAYSYKIFAGIVHAINFCE